VHCWAYLVGYLVLIYKKKTDRDSICGIIGLTVNNLIRNASFCKLSISINQAQKCG